MSTILTLSTSFFNKDTAIKRSYLSIACLVTEII